MIKKPVNVPWKVHSIRVRLARLALTGGIQNRIKMKRKKLLQALNQEGLASPLFLLIIRNFSAHLILHRCKNPISLKYSFWKTVKIMFSSVLCLYLGSHSNEPFFKFSSKISVLRCFRFTCLVQILCISCKNDILWYCPYLPFWIFGCYKSWPSLQGEWIYRWSIKVLLIALTV